MAYGSTIQIVISNRDLKEHFLKKSTYSLVFNYFTGRLPIEQNKNHIRNITDCITEIVTHGKTKLSDAEIYDSFSELIHLCYDGNGNIADCANLIIMHISIAIKIKITMLSENIKYDYKSFSIILDEFKNFVFNISDFFEKFMCNINKKIILGDSIVDYKPLTVMFLWDFCINFYIKNDILDKLFISEITDENISDIIKIVNNILTIHVAVCDLSQYNCILKSCIKKFTDRIGDAYFRIIGNFKNIEKLIIHSKKVIYKKGNKRNLTSFITTYLLLQSDDLNIVKKALLKHINPDIIDAEYVLIADFAEVKDEHTIIHKNYKIPEDEEKIQNEIVENIKNRESIDIIFDKIILKKKLASKIII